LVLTMLVVACWLAPPQWAGFRDVLDSLAMAAALRATSSGIEGLKAAPGRRTARAVLSGEA
jgi:hypothetical protein